MSPTDPTPDAPPPSGETPHPDAPRDDEPRTGEPEADGARPGQQITEVAHQRLPLRPPRRTGVFVDPDDLRRHVGELLRAILGGYEVDAFGNLTFTFEGARIVVTVGASPVGPQVGIFSVTNLDLDLSPELAHFLLTANHTLGFESFSYDERNRAIWLRHTLLGTALDLPELQAAVAAVATSAAHFDDVIGQRFGGRTFDEAPKDVRDRMEPPEPEQADPRTHPGVRGYL